jgi:hypothetical protein
MIKGFLSYSCNEVIIFPLLHRFFRVSAYQIFVFRTLRLSILDITFLCGLIIIRKLDFGKEVRFVVIGDARFF